jgi:diacylglycerol kinase family enzyme
VKIALVHNENAGDQEHSTGDLVRILHGLGHEAEAYGRDTAGLLSALNSRPDVVVVSGGDGTVARAAIALCGSDTPMFVLPMGTSNNVATSIGAGSDTVRNLAGRLASTRMTRLDVCRVIGEKEGDGFEAFFVESAGMGVIGTMLDEENHKISELRQRVRGWLSRSTDHWESTARHVARVLRRQTPRWIDMRADGVDLSGEYVTVEAMNIRAIGPRVVLAPNADPGDGWLDLVLVTAAERDELADHIEARGTSAAIPPSPARRVRHVELDWPEQGTHVDDESWPNRNASRRPRRVSIDVRGAVNVLVPD